ncbi:MAG: hypothetical protein LBU64_01045 [Planctomycetota bacterium]|jgi:hypothetical protein|nr:hypothetical protein [Planctomycetota bacterium]
MSSIKISDRRGGNYLAVVNFTYGECERLPFNILRRVNAKLEVVHGGGLKAAAEFNIRTPRESAAFLEILDFFGEEGSYVHGSAASPAELARTAAGDDAGSVSIGSMNGEDELELEEEQTN